MRRFFPPGDQEQRTGSGGSAGRDPVSRRPEPGRPQDLHQENDPPIFQTFTGPEIISAGSEDHEQRTGDRPRLHQRPQGDRAPAAARAAQEPPRSAGPRKTARLQ